MLGKESGIKLVVRIQNTEQMKKKTKQKNKSFVTFREETVQERKCSYNSLLGLAVNSTYVVIINTSYLPN